MINIDRIVDKLDMYFARNDYDGAQKHLEFWLDEAKLEGDKKAELFVLNELIGLTRKTAQKEKCLAICKDIQDLLDDMDWQNNVGGATTYLNIGTAHKAFELPELSLQYFQKAQNVYEKELQSDDKRLAGLYNNMALTLVDLGEYEQAMLYYDKAIDIAQQHDMGELDVAVSKLNIASCLESKMGINAQSQIDELCESAFELLEKHKDSRDGNYAFVCEKCAPVLGYFGFFLYENILKKRAQDIYKSN